jgi:hypothetical protein
MCMGRLQKAGWALAWTSVLVVVIVACCAADTDAAAEAPFGFAWFQPRGTLPRPSSTVADANITQLTYEGSNLPPSMKETETVALKVCEGIGLQQVKWVSRPYTRVAAVDKFLDIYDVGVKRYCQSDEGNPNTGTAGWSREGIGMLIDRDEQDRYRVIMVSDGPRFELCQAEYRRITGHQ